MEHNNKKGTLFVVATPIGNLSDISARAIETLKTVDLIACEDTRVTHKLLDHFDVQAKTTSLHQHTSCAKEESLINEIIAGLDVAVVTDAGTPAISDPGSPFVKMAVDAGINIIPIPGASAFTTALSICGFPTNRFTFVGFPPNKKGRNKFFDEIAGIEHTVVLYESKHRILKTLEQLPQHRDIMVARELTKMHETIYRGYAAKIAEQIQQSSDKGEFVIVLAPQSNKLL